MTQDQLATGIGTATVLHRLALAVECRGILEDAVTSLPLRVGRQAPPRLLPRPPEAGWPCLDLASRSPGRFKLLDHPSYARDLVLRVDDPTRRCVPRRFSVHLWPAARIREDGGPYVPVASRLVRCWLWPGAAAQLPRGTTVIRGRVERSLAPARWARVVARTGALEVAGRAHADDRGEFVLVVTLTGQNPVASQVALDLSVVAPQNPAAADPLDRCADLVVEDVPRSGSPPGPHDLDNDRLRGIAVPAGYVANTRPDTHVVAPVGGELVLTTPITFIP
jgi:hypothetical protein